MRFTSNLLIAVAAAAAASHLVQAVPHQLPFLGNSGSDAIVDSAVPITDAQLDHGLWREQHTAGLPPNVPSLDSLAAALDPDHFAQLISHIAALPEARTVALSERPEDVYTVSEGMKAVLVYAGIKFMDITDHLGTTEANTVPVSDEVAGDDSGSGKHGHGHGDAEPLPSKIKYGVKDLEKRFYKDIDTKRMKAFLTKFSSFRTRYYRSSTGKESQAWLLSQVREIANSNEHLNMTVSEFAHPWGQNSIIARLPVATNVQSKGKVVVGAHQDSTNLLPFLGAPGADDDGSGTTTVIEVLHLLTANGYTPPSYDIEFHFYSAEEGGMLGSNAIAADWAKQGVDAERIRGMLQMDMTAYVKPGTQERIGIVNDFVSPELTSYIKGLIDEYNTIPWVDSKCGYACSDHSAWTKVGVPSAFAIEATFEDSNTRLIHSSGDVLTAPGFSFDHMAQFVRLSTAFVMELAA